MATPNGVRDSALMLEAIDDLSRAAGQREQLPLNLRQSSASPPKLPTEMQIHTADTSKDFPPISPPSLESPWTLYGDGRDGTILSSELETSPRRLSHLQQVRRYPPFQNIDFDSDFAGYFPFNVNGINRDGYVFPG
jgi:hypothetical protein